jgi:hypothetical protein
MSDPGRILTAQLFRLEITMSTSPDLTPVGPTHKSRPSKLMLLILAGVLVGFFAVVLTHKEPAAPGSAPTTQQQ